MNKSQIMNCSTCKANNAYVYRYECGDELGYYVGCMGCGKQTEAVLSEIAAIRDWGYLQKKENENARR